MTDINLNAMIHSIEQIASAITVRHLDLCGVNLPPRQAELLRYVATHDGASQKSLVDASRVDRSTLSAIVQSLIKRGLVSRVDNPNDMRAYIVTATAAGKGLLKQIERAHVGADKEIAKAFGAPRAMLRANFANMIRRVGGTAETDDARAAA